MLWKILEARSQLQVSSSSLSTVTGLLTFIRKHYNRKHNRRLNCVFQNDCDYLGADKKELHRHYWVSHKEYARVNKIPDPSGTCEACGKYFSRKDRIPRHLSRSLSCRIKLGLKK